MSAKPLAKVKYQRARGVIDWRPAFLRALESCGVILEAAAGAQISVMTVWRERQTNPEFEMAYQESLGVGALLLEKEAIRRAKDGVRRMKFNSKTGEPYLDPETKKPYIEHEFSDTLMIALLKRHFPEYRDKETTIINDNRKIFVLSASKLLQLQERHKELLEAV